MKKRIEELTLSKRTLELAIEGLIQSKPEKYHFWIFVITKVCKQINQNASDIKNEKD